MTTANSDYVRRLEEQVDSGEITANEGFHLLLGAVKQGDAE